MSMLGLLLSFSCLIFCLGLFGVLSQRNILRIFIPVMMMFLSVILNFIFFNYFLHNKSLIGFGFSFIVLVISSIELVVCLGFILVLYQHQGNISEEKMDYPEK